jgi:hypothetical protein
LPGVFEGSLAKLERAKEHIDELARDIVAYFARNAAYVTFEIAGEYADTGASEMGSFTFRKREEIPFRWAAILGDALHNLRSSLDVAVCEAYILSNGDLKGIAYVYYPFCKAKNELGVTIRKRRLHRLRRPFLDIIEATAPYSGGNDGLRAIHDLNIYDEHQALVPTLSIVALDWPVEIKSGSQKFVAGIVKDGQRLILFPRAFCPLPLGSKIRSDFSIVFGDVPAFGGREIVHQLRACHQGVEGIISLFRARAMD